MLEQKTKNLIVCAFAHGYNHGTNSIHAVAIPLLVSSFAIGYSLAGLMSTLFFVSYALISYPAGKYSTRLGRRELIVFYLIAGAIVFFATGLSPNYVTLLFLQLIAGAIFGIYHPSGTVLVIDSYEEGGRGKALGYHEVGGVGGALVILLLGGIVAKWLGWRYLFFVFALPGMLIGLFCWIWAKDVDISGKGLQRGGGTTNLPAVIAIILCTGLEMLSVIGFRTWSTALLMDRFKIGITLAASISALAPATSLITSPLFGHVSDRSGREVVLYSVLLAFSGSLLGVAYANDLVLMSFVLIVSGAVYIAIIPIGNAYLSDAVSSSQRGSVFGIHIGFMFAMQTVAPVGIGLMADAFGFASGMVLLSLISFIGFLIILLVPRLAKPLKIIIGR